MGVLPQSISELAPNLVLTVRPVMLLVPKGLWPRYMAALLTVYSLANDRVMMTGAVA